MNNKTCLFASLLFAALFGVNAEGRPQKSAPSKGVYSATAQLSYERRISHYISLGYPSCEEVDDSDDYDFCIEEEKDGYLLPKSKNTYTLPSGSSNLE